MGRLKEQKKDQATILDSQQSFRQLKLSAKESEQIKLS